VRYSNNVYGYVCIIVCDDHEAEDITQHVFAELMTALVKIRRVASRSSLGFRRLARNLRSITCGQIE
jgi:DNA-directed RNA polymerase specialized sigma24 family protein